MQLQQNNTVLITGSTGFLARQIIACWPEINFIKLARNGGDLNMDMRQPIAALPQVGTVIHTAGSAHKTSLSKEEQQALYCNNVDSTTNLLAGLTAALPKQFVFISSVSVYGCLSGRDIPESAPLAARDAYGLSKIKCEQLVQEWCTKYGVTCTILRLPLIAGPNPPGNLERMIHAIRKGFFFLIGPGDARKSMVLAKDVGRFIFDAANIGGIYNLTDGEHPSFAAVAKLIAQKVGRRTVPQMPVGLARLLAFVGDHVSARFPLNKATIEKMTATLTFDDQKARNAFQWKPLPVIENFEL